MTPIAAPAPTATPPSSAQPSRRGFFFGAAAAGAAAAAVTVLPRIEATEPVAVTLPPAPERGGGYSASEHVQRYYKTTRI